jgi:dTDP-4-dehydrorhamnose 3,5-epimerase-like enzyme
VNRLSQVGLIKRSFRSDSRGWLLKVIDGHEKNLPAEIGEVYLVLSRPGQVRGNHFHRQTSEWFTVVTGKAKLLLCDPETDEIMHLDLDSMVPTTVYVPSGIAHAFDAISDTDEPMLMVAYADRPFDPMDTVRYNLL